MTTDIMDAKTRKRNHWAWYMYDFGNSAYAAVILLAVFSPVVAEELEEIWAEWRDKAEETHTLEVGLEKTDIRVEDLVLFWAPIG